MLVTASCVGCNAFAPLSLRSAFSSSLMIPSKNVPISRACAVLKLSKGNNSDSTTYADNLEQDDLSSYDKGLGLLVLLTVPLSWGTYAPIVKSIYEMEVPIPGLLFSAGYYLIAAITLSLLALSSSEHGNEKSENRGNFISTTESSKQSTSSQLLGGFELGSYLFIGNCLQVVGLKEVPADRAAFLVQLTTIFVPIVSATFAGNFNAVPIPTWFACIIAFLGVIIMGLDSPKTNDLSLLSISNDLFRNGFSFSASDFLIVLAAFAYTMHVVRLSTYAKYTSPLGLAASKATVEAGLSIGLVAALLNVGTTNVDFLNELSSDVHTYFSVIQSQITSGSFPPAGSDKAIVAVFWTAWVTCAYTIYAQSYGQRRVSATDANLIYSVQPVFSALFAWALLGEQLDIFGYIGAFLIGLAVWIVASLPEDSPVNKL